MITAYQLACGYIDARESGALSTTLWREHGVYHVRTFERTLPEGESVGRGRIAWETFRTLKAARKEASKQWRESNGGAR